VRPALRVDRDAGGAEGLDVAVDGPNRDLQLAGQLGRGQPTAVLEVEEQLEEARGAHAPA
jgi:hypothetical protein